jgi:uncharacterized protein
MAILFGFLIAVVICLTGIGGGTLTAPVLVLLLKLPPSQSVGTALVFSAVVKAYAALLYLHRKQVDLRALRYLLLGGIPGAAIGGISMEGFRWARHSGNVLVIVGVTVTISAVINMLPYHIREMRKESRPVLLALLSFPVSILVGFSSVGAGALGTSLLVGLTTLPAASVVGTDLTYGLAISAVGGAVHIAAGNWSSPVLVKMIFGGVLGVVAGSSLSQRLRPTVLRIVVLSWAAMTGLLLIFKGLSLGT